MSAETITTAIFLITAVVATAVLVNAIYPVIYSTAGTFQSSTHDADTRLRTDFKIVANFASPAGTADIYMKNIGSQRISTAEIANANVFCGKTVGNLLTYGVTWSADIVPADDTYWDTGETLHIHATTSIDAGKTVYFQFVLPNGIWRSQEFNAESS
ncbi:MAG: flagellin [Methanoregula sp.]|nr:flagellin [Methanoregula sp.]